LATDSHAVSVRGLRHHFADMEQQRESATLGMWLFLVTEIMFFGGLFAAYLVYRINHYEAWKTGSEHMGFWLGTTNTVILLCSSLTMALGVWSAQMGKRKLIVLFLVLTMLFGIAFECIKGYEYYEHFHEGSLPGKYWHLDVPNPRQVELFFFLYFTMTGIHALHLAIGIIVVGFIAWWAWRGHYTPEYHNPVHITGLYWHFVDVIWIFLYPLLYLIGHVHH
jgi:cytochrome c oxidase subunit III